MKVKMVKMGMDIDETRNHRIRGIVPTEDGKYLFLEILEGNRPNIRYTNLSPSEYSLKYPYEEYVWIDSCFRVDIPEDYYKNYTAEFSEYGRKSFTNLKHTKENIVKILQEFNKNIDDIELVDDYYIDKFCEEKGFFRLYDNRLKHSYSPKIVFWSDLEKDGETQLDCIYTCYSADGSVEYTEERRRFLSINEMIQEYGIDMTKILIDEYINNLSKKYDKPASQEHLKTLAQELFNDKNTDISLEQEDEIEIA